jgi:minor extracellular serine protease Vpr
VTLSESSFNLAAGQSRQITARLEGTRPAAGLYEGEIVIAGGSVPIRVPYLYLVGDSATDNALPLRGASFVAEANQRLRLAFKLVDRYGVGVSGVPVTFRPTVGGGAIDVVVTPTDSLGIAEATVFVGPQLGEQEFIASAGGFDLVFNGRARLAPVIQTDGVVNAASGQVGRGVAPGSYISIFGRNLSETLLATSTPWLPYGLAGVSVSFDVPGPRSIPGRIHFVSEGQINVQVPWELQGLNSAQLKVSIGDSSSALYSLPLNDNSPAAFEFPDPATGRLLAAALDQESRLVTTDNPVGRGRVAQIFANGIGPVDNAPPSGEPSPAQPLATSRVPPEVTIGGVRANVMFSGLAPGFVGLYQINVLVPADAPTGVQPVIITSGGVSSKSTSLPIN